MTEIIKGAEQNDLKDSPNKGPIDTTQLLKTEETLRDIRSKEEELNNKENHPDDWLDNQLTYLGNSRCGSPLKYIVNPDCDKTNIPKKT